MQKTKILYLDGSPYDNGNKSGRYFKNNVNININKIINILSNDKIKIEVKKQMDNLKEQFPKYYEEVIGKADGLGIDRLTYFAILCPEILGINFEHCTTVICRKENGNLIISHNEDDEYVEGNFCLSKVKIDDNNWFVTNDMYNMPFGNGISWNSYGILKTINYCHDDNIRPEYLPRYFSQRHISEAKSIEDLIDRAKEIKIASGYHINAIDINKNIAVSIEVYNDNIDAKYIEDNYAHSNHFIHGNYCEEQKVDIGSNSIFRLHKATELLNESERNILKIRNILNYRSKEDKFENSILQTKDDPYQTIFNLCYDTDNKEHIILDIYVHNEKIKLDYNI